jgi:precorrin-6Y C5,15-methyltransferase (decarboxylating)
MRDELFIRGEVPMTKSEVRSISISKLELSKDSVLYDVGAGTGSVSIEAALSMAEGTVYAIEKKNEAIELIYKNIEKFSTSNVIVTEGEAPEALLNLPVPTHAFIGGTSGNMDSVLDLLLNKNPDIRIVINVIALESLQDVMDWLKKKQIEAEIVHVQISKAKTAGRYHMMMGNNPVYVVSFGGNT